MANADSNTRMHLIPRKRKTEDILAEIFGSESDNKVNKEEVELSI